MSGDRTPLRFDVVAGTRRSWSREQKAAIVAEVGVAGASVSQVARRHGLNAGLLGFWAFVGHARNVCLGAVFNGRHPALEIPLGRRAAIAEHGPAQRLPAAFWQGRP